MPRLAHTTSQMTWLPQQLTDEEAMRLVRVSGDHGAFTRLVARWEQPIRRLCVRMTGDQHRGEDLAQEAFARVFANRHRYADGKRFSTWLWRIALNLCHENARRLAVRGERSIEFVDVSNDASHGPHEHAVESERAAMVREALARLPESHRAVVVLREYENLKFREIADVLDVPEGTVKWRMAEAMQQLTRALRPRLAADEEDGAVERRPEGPATPGLTAKASVAL